LNAIEKLPGKQVLNSAKLIPEMIRMNWFAGLCGPYRTTTAAALGGMGEIPGCLQNNYQQAKQLKLNALKKRKNLFLKNNTRSFIKIFIVN
jgi:hypothetical protein